MLNKDITSIFCVLGLLIMFKKFGIVEMGGSVGTYVWVCCESSGRGLDM